MDKVVDSRIRGGMIQVYDFVLLAERSDRSCIKGVTKKKCKILFSDLFQTFQFTWSLYSSDGEGWTKIVLATNGTNFNL